MESIKAISESSSLKIQIYTSDTDETIELKNIETQEKLMFMSWKHVTQYLETQGYKDHKGLR